MVLFFSHFPQNSSYFRRLLDNRYIPPPPELQPSTTCARRRSQRPLAASARRCHSSLPPFAAVALRLSPLLATARHRHRNRCEQKHFVLVHGACHGAWCWFKLKPLLEAAGHRVTAFDLSASGTDTKLIQQVHTLSDYTLPLLKFMAAVSPEEKVVVVGHSLGGMNLALVMERFPEKVAVGVFLAAFMPDSVHQPSYVIDTINERIPTNTLLDTQFLPYDNENDLGTSVVFGPKFLSSNVYQLCSVEDLELGKILVRPGSLFLNDLSKARPFSKERYGSVKRVYVICDEDKTIIKEFQQWMVNNDPVVETKELKGVDHMAMLSGPKQLCACLVDIALQYA